METPPSNVFDPKRAIKAAVTARLRVDGFRGRWPTFRKRLADDRYALLKFIPARTSSGGGIRADRPAFYVETALMRPGDEESLGGVRGHLRSSMIRLLPDDQIWSDIFEHPDDIRSEATAEAFAEEVMAVVIAEGPRFWQVHWWEDDWQRRDPVKSHWEDLFRRPVLRLGRLEEAWAAGTADLPRPDVLSWLRKHASDK